MKKYMLNLKENEEMMNDFDDQMESILKDFTKAIKGLKLNEKKLQVFANWVKVYKMLNYDIIPELEVEKVYKINDIVAGVIVKFRGVREFDLLSLNPNDMTVTCLNTKDGKQRDYITRRLLIPTTVEEALMYAKRDLDEIGKKLLVTTFEQIKKYNKKLDVTVLILNGVNTEQEEIKTDVNTEQEEIKTEQRKLRRIPKIRQLKPKQEEVKEEPKQEEVKEEPKQEEVKEEPKQEEVKEEPKQEEVIRTEAEIIEDCIKRGKDIDWNELRKARARKIAELEENRKKLHKWC